MINSKEILKTLSVDEKIRLLSGVGSWYTYDCNKKIPQIMLSDGPHGLRKQQVESYMDINKSEVATCFPSESALSCSWDREVLAKLADAIASEALKEKVSVVLGPGVNIKRNPLCGRNFEYFSEDPFLSGELGVSYINAMQKRGVGTSLKHFACNSQEKFRQTQNSVIDQRTMHEIYLSAFEKIVKEAKPTTIMAAYNRINGGYCCHNSYLLKEILREKWGYRGLVVSDWGAAIDIVKCIKNGLGLEMPDANGRHTEQLKKAYDSGLLSEQEIDQAALNVVELVVSQAEKLQDFEVDYQKQNEIAADIAAQCCVLLKNEQDILPLQKDADILIVGEMAQEVRFQGGGSSHITVGKIKSHVESLFETFENADFAMGYSDDEINLELEKQAVEKAKNSRYVVFFGGLTDKYEGEGFDRKNLNLPKNQESLLEKLYQANSNIIFVASAGSAFVIKNIDKVKALLQAHLGGQAISSAVAKLLSGEVNPCGKLTETYPLAIGDVPSTRWFAKETNNVFYGEGLFVGYRYFDTYDIPVLFDFGFGLSYTKFEYSDISLSSDSLSSNGVTVRFTVKNVGEKEGAEIVQVYIKNNDQAFYRAKRELGGFEKISLKPGESKRVEIELSSRSFSVYNEITREFEVVGGEYEIEVSASLKDVKLCAPITADGISDKLAVLGKRESDIENMTKTVVQKLEQLNNKDFDDIKKGEYTLYNTFTELEKVSGLVKILVFFLKRTIINMSKDKDKDNPETKMILFGVLENTLDCIITQSNGVFTEHNMGAILLWVNGHPFKAIKQLFKG